MSITETIFSTESLIVVLSILGALALITIPYAFMLFRKRND
jgi:type II secretory pathway pseudopilin PulG